MKKIITTLIFTFIFLASNLTCFSQNQVHDLNKINLPPGSVMPPKFEFVDYSYKLNYVNSASTMLVEKNFLVEFSEEDLAEIKNNTPAKYEYYMKAQDYYSNLSDKVKSTFTTKELWYVYMFDNELTNKLLKIK